MFKSILQLALWGSVGFVQGCASGVTTPTGIEDQLCRRQCDRGYAMCIDQRHPEEACEEARSYCKLPCGPV
jgi:hypothetical protein